MEMEIKEKYNNFIQVIEKKEQIEWLNQSNNNGNNDNNTCKCELSSGLESVDENTSKTKVDSEKMNKKESSNDKIKYLDSDSNKNLIYDNNELSLLDDNNYYINNNNITVNNNKNVNKNVKNNYTEYSDITDTKSIKTEFRYLFDTNKNIKIKQDLESNLKTKNELDKMFNKIIKKKVEKFTEEKNNKIKNPNAIYDLNGKINLETQENINSAINYLSDFLEKNVFEESTRGWNMNDNVYILNFDILKNTLSKIKFTNNSNIKLGYFYRDYTNTKIHN